jgi:hypothetical protein
LKGQLTDFFVFGRWKAYYTGFIEQMLKKGPFLP